MLNFKWYKKPLTNWINEHVIMYPSPINLNYWWSFGSLAGITLVIQIITGLLLTMHYTPHIDYAFISVEHIMRDVNYGWLIRYTHSNGASMFFIVIYLHIGKGLYYGSYLYPREYLWISGVFIFILLMGIAFLGYVLPWGQMSFWGATVITNFVTIIPYVGENILYWIWGGFSINNSTLNRFYTLHFLLPFVLLGLVFLHLALLHNSGSGNPLGIDWATYLPLYPYFVIKDLFSLISYLFIFSIFIFLFPNFLGHSDNYIPANPYVTPTHVVPEWYFLPFYAILRSIPDKFFGVILMLASILILTIFPFITNYTYVLSKLPFKKKYLFNIHPNIRSGQFRPLFSFFFWFLVFDVLFLGWLGMQPVEQPFIFCGQVALIYYFIFFLLIIPFLNIYEEYLIHLQIKYLNEYTLLLNKQDLNIKLYSYLQYKYNFKNIEKDLIEHYKNKDYYELASINYK